MRAWLTVIVIVAASSCVRGAAHAPSTSTVARTEVVPADPWVGIYFPSIDRLARDLGLKPLRTSQIAPGDLEFRMWEGFGLGPLRAYVIKRQEQTWSVRAATQWSNQRPQVIAPPLATDWAEVWDRLERGGIRSVADDSVRKACSVVLDGVGYVVEIATSESYRTFLVSNPQSQRSADGDRFLGLAAVLHEAFGEGSGPDVTALPRGETRTVAKVVGDGARPSPSSATGVWHPAGADVEGPAMPLASTDALGQAIEMPTYECWEFPMNYRITGEVSLELRIGSDGRVLAARALAALPPILGQPSINAALRWRFQPMAGTQLRSTVLTLRYQDEWVLFPWLPPARGTGILVNMPSNKHPLDEKQSPRLSRGR